MTDSPNSIATVVLDGRVPKPLDYSIPKSLASSIKKGVRVIVPLRTVEVKATVIQIRSKSQFKSLQPILKVITNDVTIKDDLLYLAKWMSQYYVSSYQKVLKTIIPSSVRNEHGVKSQLFVRPNISKKKLLEFASKKREKFASQSLVLDAIIHHFQGIYLSEILAMTRVSPSPVNTLAKEGILSISEKRVDRALFLEEEYFLTKPYLLEGEQKQALEAINTSIVESRYETHLIFGITGSGKTEIYLQAMQKTLDEGKNILFIVPEVALTSQTVERIKTRFKERLVVLHHRVSDGEKADSFRAIEEKKVRICIGARSCIFAPLDSIGLIIIDEEQDHSLKASDEMPCYNARDVAIVRARSINATVVLGSATPSFESYTNALSGKYTLHHLTKRAGKSSPPEVQLIDMSAEREKKHSFFSTQLLTEITACYERGEQALLFLNRRGYYSLYKCHSCDTTLSCPHCDVSLTFHKSENTLACHMCGFTLSPLPTTCKNCNSDGFYKFHGPGTEQVERSLKAILPFLRVLRMDGDTTRLKGSHERLYKEFRSGKADVLIGTQMVAKGLHFPSITLVGVLNADAGLSIPDFRRSEQIFQLVTQVSGRAGRGMLPGKVLIQTRNIDNPLFAYATKEDYTSFYAKEVESRKIFGYPPFGNIVKIVISSLNEEQAFKKAKELQTAIAALLPLGYTIASPTQCGHKKIKDQFRFQMLLRGKSSVTMSKMVTHVLKSTIRKKEVSITVDVDPLTTFS